MDETFQIFDTVNIGLVILDRDLRVQHWNRWMALHSGKTAEEIIGSSIFEFFPDLNNPRFLRNCQSVLAFGNLTFFSQKLHRYLFPFKPESFLDLKSEFMQQSCTMGPLRDHNNSIKSLFITVQDVTDMVIYEHKLLEMNLRDGLTGIYNRRFLEVRLKEEFERNKRYLRNLSLIMFDIDFFKRVNDTYGHLCGDFILQSIASRVATLIREGDCLARYGGEEFCCILPETGINGALIIAERIRKTISEMENNFHNVSIVTTISLGVAETSQGVESPEKLIKFADKALYEAKKMGRNKVVAYSELISE
jgi:diguanylate cyclase